MKMIKKGSLYTEFAPLPLSCAGIPPCLDCFDSAAQNANVVYKYPQGEHDELHPEFSMCMNVSLSSESEWPCTNNLPAFLESGKQVIIHFNRSWQNNQSDLLHYYSHPGTRTIKLLLLLLTHFHNKEPTTKPIERRRSGKYSWRDAYLSARQVVTCQITDDTVDKKELVKLYIHFPV